MPELIMFILGAMWIKENRWKLLMFLIPISAFNRETSIALVLLYFLNGFNNKKVIKRSVIYFLLWLIPTVTLYRIFGVKDMPYFMNMVINIRGLLEMFKNPHPYNHYYFVIYLCGFYWFLAFMNFRKKDIFLRKSIIVIALFFIYAFFRAAGIHEARVFIPFYVFIMPLGLMSLFTEDI
jgi:hypothetical protein